jgi:CRP-like cAMP-binding protein
MEKVALIQQVPLFHGLEETDLNKLSEIAIEKKFVAGSQIFAEGEKGDSLYVIKYGTIRVMKHGKQGEEEVARMSNGQHFGEMAIIDNDTRSATVDTLELTELIQISREDLKNLLAQDHALGHRVYEAFCKYLCYRLRQTTDDLTFMREIAKRNRA